MKNFKFKYFGHDIVNLYEREIRKSKGDFDFLKNQVIRPYVFKQKMYLISNFSFYRNRLIFKFIYRVITQH